MQDDLAQFFIDEGINISARTKSGDTALHIAARYDRHKMVEELLDMGEDIAATNNDKNTPLHEAAFHGSLKAICVLMKQGADPTALNSHNQSPLDYTEDKPDVQDYIVNHNNYIC